MIVLMVGAGGHASDLLGVYEANAAAFGEPSPVLGLVDDGSPKMSRFAGRGVSLLGKVDTLASHGASHYLVAVGWPRVRRDLAERVQGLGLVPTTLVHHEVELGRHVYVGEGSVVLAGAHLSPMVSVGRHSLVSHGALIGHDALIGDFVSIMPGAAVSGDSVVEDGAMVGTHATVLQGVRIVQGATLGAGAVALHDVPPRVTALGVPARW